mmetsp:Transcript_75177/g.140191  ORF Transcript_75177/g.140191 Transcript_75177/m.140191 type:complete len:89 (+) Transcript_75177:1232-1498(+)
MLVRQQKLRHWQAQDRTFLDFSVVQGLRHRFCRQSRKKEERPLQLDAESRTRQYGAHCVVQGHRDVTQLNLASRGHAQQHLERMPSAD